MNYGLLYRPVEPHGFPAVAPALRRAEPSDPSAKAYGRRAEAYPPSPRLRRMPSFIPALTCRAFFASRRRAKVSSFVFLLDISSFQIQKRSNISGQENCVVGHHEPGRGPGDPFHKGGGERPKVWGREVARAMGRDVAEYMYAPSQKNPRGMPPYRPDQDEHGCPDN